MIGYVWKDTLSFSLAQWGWMVFLTASNLWLWHTSREHRPFSISLLWTCELLTHFVLFYNQQHGIDVHITWNVLPRLTGLSWHQFKSQFSFVNYLWNQPPLWSFLLSRAPWYVFQQSCGLVGAALVLAFTYRRTSAVFLLAACPIFWLMNFQPSNDWWAYVWLSCALYFRRRWAVCALCLVCAASLKYTIYSVLPLLVFAVPINSLLVLLGVVAWYWSEFNVFGVGQRWHTAQWNQLMHISSFGTVKSITGTFDAGAWFPRLTSRIRWVCDTFFLRFWRGAWYWIFPGYLLRHDILWWGTLVAMLLFYGNLKYLVMLLPFWMLEEENREYETWHVGVLHYSAPNDYHAPYSGGFSF